MAVARHVLTRKSKDHWSRSDGYENCNSRMVASEVCCWGRVLLLLAWDCMSDDCLGIFLAMLAFITLSVVSQETVHPMCQYAHVAPKWLSLFSLSLSVSQQ